MLPHRFPAVAVAIGLSACGLSAGGDARAETGSTGTSGRPGASSENGPRTTGETTEPDTTASRTDSTAADATDGVQSSDSAAEASSDSGGEPVVCDVNDGLVLVRDCTEADPCDNPAEGTIDTPSTPPICATESDDHPLFDDGPATTFVDSAGVERHACIYTPPGASPADPVPLLIWLHGGSGTATGLYNTTLVRSRAEDFDLSDNVNAPGYVVASVQSRNLHWPYGRLNGGRHQDSAHWRVEDNRDVENLDRIIDTLVATDLVDPLRIYLMGWSEGGMLAQLYAFERYDAPTPGGHRVAAVAIYSATSPFDRAIDESSRCVKSTLPTSTVPMMFVSRTCDVVPCDDDQRDVLWNEGSFADVISAAHWLPQLQDDVGNPNVTWSLIGAFGVINPSCAARCAVETAAFNHIVWPDGTTPPNSVDQEAALLAFLRDHPRTTP